MIYYFYLKIAPDGLKYVGITIQNPYKYRGSGIYWSKHLYSHDFCASDLITIILFSSTSEEEVNAFAFKYSIDNNIVDSKEYANLMPESGIGSTKGRRTSDETKRKIGRSNKGRKPSQETIDRIIKNRKSTKGYKHTEETKKKLSEMAFKRGKRSMEIINKIRDKQKGVKKIKNCKAVHQYSLQGEYLKSFNCINEAMELYGGDVYNTASGRNKSAAGYQWSFNKQERINSLVPHKCKKVYQYTLDGVLLKIWNGTKDPSNQLDINRGAIRNCLCGISKTAGGYKWKYE